MSHQGPAGSQQQEFWDTIDPSPLFFDALGPLSVYPSLVDAYPPWQYSRGGAQGGPTLVMIHPEHQPFRARALNTPATPILEALLRPNTSGPALHQRAGRREGMGGRQGVRGTQNPAPERFVCERCGRSYMYKSGLARHRTISHRGVRIKCSKCNMDFTRTDSLHDHYVRTHGARN